MPQVTVYVRDEDLDRWKSIKRKSEFIHQALNEGVSQAGVSPISDKQPTVVSRPEIKPTIPVIAGLTTANKLKSNGACKIHGLPLTVNGRCLQKGCKYA